MTTSKALFAAFCEAQSLHLHLSWNIYFRLRSLISLHHQWKFYCSYNEMKFLLFHLWFYIASFYF
jgi:hypothetical protein